MTAPRNLMSSISICLVAVTLACGEKKMAPSPRANESMLSDAQIQSLTTKTIFFGHRSVGENIVEGIGELMVSEPGLRLVASSDPAAESDSAFIHAELGENGDPQSKNQAFLNALRGFGQRHGIALFKYCYADVDSSTDVGQLFAGYRKTIAAAKAAHPALTLVHVTVPLTTSDSSLKAFLKSAMGRPTLRDANQKRNQFNRLLKQTYAADPIFDLAEAESTHSDGSRESFTQGGETIYSLAPEFTTDGGHLNQKGRVAVARKLLLLVSNL